MHLIAKFGLLALSFGSLNVYAESLARQNLDMYTQLEQIQTELQSLRGELEVNQHKLAQMEQQQRDYYDDLNQRINALSANSTAQPTAAPYVPAAVATTTPPAVMTTPAPATTVAPVPAPAMTTAPAPVVPVTTNVDTTQAVAAVSNAGSDLAAYQAGYQYLQNKQYPEAVAAFNTYLQTYPQGEYAANVDYWLGEIYLIQRNYPLAEQSFSRVVTQYPQHQKSADALLKLGYVYEAAGDTQKALTTFEQVQQRYSGTAVAHLAQTKVDQLRRQTL